MRANATAGVAADGSPSIAALAGRPLATGKSLAERIWGVLQNPKLRRSSDDDLVMARTHYIAQIQAAIDACRPVELAAIMWPFKIHRKSTRRYPDLGELAMIRQMARIALQVKKLYHHGMRWIIFTETEAYADLLGTPRDYLEVYQEGMDWLLRLSGVGHLFERISLADSIHHDTLWDQYVEEEAGKLRRHVAEHGAIDVLGSHFLKTMWSAAQVLDDDGLHTLVSTFENSLDGDARARERCTRVVDVTIRYLAMNTAKHRVHDGAGFLACAHDATLARRKLAETALYVTITPKPGRLAFWPIQKGLQRFPHHGRAVVTNSGRQLSIMTEAEIATRELRPIHFDDDIDQSGEPFAFTNGGSGGIPLESWNI